MATVPENNMAGLVSGAARRHGVLMRSVWHDAHPDTESNLIATLEALEPTFSKASALEVNIAHQLTSFTKPLAAIGQIERGLKGLVFKYLHADGTSTVQVFTPTEMIARNLSFARAGDLFRKAIESQFGKWEESRQQIEWFASHQRLYDLQQRSVVSLYRGNKIVSPEEVTRDATVQLADRMGEWLTTNTHADGRITYKYWPSRGQESDTVNLIRLFMAVLCLIRLARWKNDTTIMEQARTALSYHLQQFYRQEGALGYVLEGDKVKLGACALAALAIEELPDADAFSTQHQGLLAMIEHLWQSDGAFRTFYQPQDRNDCQNFYPGEALLYWATRWRHTSDSDLLERIYRSFQYYQAWHQAQPNPAFVPWHTQAAYVLWKATKDNLFKEAVFRMNDWLLPIQQGDELGFPDERGRFYDPNRPFGPPHASSTGVYVEGLIDAWQLAQTVNDTHRVNAYGVAIRRALRSLMQLQYKDETDMFYISKKSNVYGGLRTTCYHNEIRVDNVQHGFMGAMKILESTFF